MSIGTTIRALISPSCLRVCAVSNAHSSGRIHDNERAASVAGCIHERIDEAGSRRRLVGVRRGASHGASPACECNRCSGRPFPDACPSKQVPQEFERGAEAVIDDAIGAIELALRLLQPARVKLGNGLSCLPQRATVVMLTLRTVAGLPVSRRVLKASQRLQALVHVCSASPQSNL
jgi:hypothetical protein